MSDIESIPLSNPLIEPQVQVAPKFVAGENVRCASTGEIFPVIAVTAEGHLKCQGRAGLMPASAALKI